MCGIFGIVTAQEEILGPMMIEAGHRLSYRGYDSVGCATLKGDHTIDLRKDVGKVVDVANRLNFAEMTGQRGILQLRWATFGNPSQVNAQPHLDSDGDLVGAHNGNVVNNLELRQQFQAEGMVVRSSNDGESCVHAVERHLDQGQDFIEAIRSAYTILDGDYAFVIGKNDENCLYAVKKGSGLVIGIGEGFTCVSSDLPSILPLTRTIVRVQDGEIITLWAERIELHRVSDGCLIEREPEQIEASMDAAQKGGYAHFMLKEIHEQPQVAGELIHLLSRSQAVDLFMEKISQARNLYLVGCGTSYHACMLGSVYLARLAGRTAIPILAPQFTAQFGATLTKDDVGIFVSQSGETKDVLDAVEYAKTKGVCVLGLVNVIGSSLILASLASLPMTCGYEISVPATKTFTNQCISFLYLALRLAVRTGRTVQNLASIGELDRLPELMEETLAKSMPQITNIIPVLKDWNDMYCLGFGLTYPIALEGALKLKEITYAHCEGMLSTEFKHGPLSAVQEGYPVLFSAVKEAIPLLVSGINEVTCRGGVAIVVGPEDPRLRANADYLIVIPDASPEISALLTVIPLQLLSYQLSLERGYHPDFPRNLSKTLTVD